MTGTPRTGATRDGWPGTGVNGEDLRGILLLVRGLGSGRIPIARIRAELPRAALVHSTVPGVSLGLFGQLLRFGAVGVASTVAFFVLYLLLRPIGAQPANLVALLLTAVANTAANRRLTFGITGSEGALRHHLGGLAAFGVALVLTSGSLWLLGAWWPEAGKPVEVVVLANAAATLLGFVSLRLLLHRSRIRQPSA